MRVKRGFKARHRRKKFLKLAKGFRGRSSTTIRQARARVEKALAYAYRDRKAKKRDFRRLWIQRINASLTEHQISYSRFIDALKKANVELDRKVLAELGATSPEAFAEVAKLAKSQTDSKAAA